MYTAIITVQTYMKDAGTHVYGTLHMPTQSEKETEREVSLLRVLACRMIYCWEPSPHGAPP